MTAEDSAAAPKPDARMARTRGVVLEAGRELLAESGVGGITIEAISRRTGIARTTVYRQWPSRDHLVMAVVAEVAFEMPRPDTGDPRRDIFEILVAMWSALAEPGRRSAFAGMIANSAFDHQLELLHHAFVDDRARPLDDAVARAVDSGTGELGVEADMVRDLLAAPILVKALVRAEPVDRDYVDRVMRNVLGPP